MKNYNSIDIKGFIKRAKNTHGDIYDYSKTIYNGYHEKLKINCRTHGIFEQRAKHHISKSGCQKCRNLRLSKLFMTKWGDEEILFLKNNYPKLSIKKISNSLGKCTKVISDKLKELQIVRPKTVQVHKYIPNYLWYSLVKGSQSRNLLFEINTDQIWRLYIKQKKRCVLSGQSIKFSKIRGETTASIDRINSNLGYTIDNVQIVHKHINRLKMDWPEKDLYNMCDLISSYSKSKFIDYKVEWEDDHYNDTIFPVRTIRKN